MKKSKLLWMLSAPVLLIGTGAAIACAPNQDQKDEPDKDKPAQPVESDTPVDIDSVKDKAILTKSTISKERLENSNDILITISYKEDDWTSKEESEWTDQLIETINKKIVPEIDALLANEKKEDFVSTVSFSDFPSVQKEELKIRFLYGLKTKFTEEMFNNLDELKFPEVKITDEQVTSEKTINQDKYFLNNTTDETVKTGNIIIMDYVGKIDGVAFDDGSDKNSKLEIGSNRFIPGFEDQIIGHKKGETFDIKVTFPANYRAENLKGKEATFTITLHDVIVSKKEDYTDLIAKNHLTNNAYKNNIEQYIADSVNAFIKKNNLKVAMSEVYRRVEREIARLTNYAKQNGATLEQLMASQGFSSVAQYRNLAVNQEYNAFKKFIVADFLKEKQLIDFTLSEESKETMIKAFASLNNISYYEVKINVPVATLNAIYQNQKLAEYFAKKQNSEAEFKLYSDFLNTL
ncbi:FKBP-type peptidyl-prolyl cis-trans isomerase [Mycoplasmopsis agassizii]|uniref:FKBP-type peptidyl-prolyl cis-trans isomerase n=1 Tax=Mycoplasmopsis agassizii TaxID=33922 RepID=UPI0035297558